MELVYLITLVCIFKYIIPFDYWFIVGGYYIYFLILRFYVFIIFDFISLIWRLF